MIIIKDGVDGKVCDTCLIWKTFEYFYKNRGIKDGHQNKCKTCQMSYYFNPDFCCSICKRRRGDFRDHGGHIDEEFGKHKSYCLVCLHDFRVGKRGFGGIYYESESRAAEKRRKSETEAGFIDYYESELLQHIYGDLCLYSDNENGPICGVSCKSHSDHVIPLSKNGMHYVYNRQPLCRSHNSSKSNHNNIDYRPDQGILAMAIHNLRIGQCNDRKNKKLYYDWVVEQIEINGAQILHSLPNIFEWLEPIALTTAA